MRHIIIALILVLVPVLSAAGDSRLLFLAASSQCKAQTGTVNTIYNGTSSLDYIDGEDPDTGTGIPSTYPLCSGTVSLIASCYGGGAGTSVVSLIINGVTAQTLSCTSAETKIAQTLSAPVSGLYSVRIMGSSSGNGSFDANAFVLPVAQ